MYAWKGRATNNNVAKSMQCSIIYVCMHAVLYH